MLPCLPLADYFLSGPRSLAGANAHQRILRNVTLASNPFRLSYFGKEFVFARYNYFKKLKKNHLAKVQLAVERLSKQPGKTTAAAQAEETLKVARTVLHQGNLMPLSPIVQPVLWSHATDALNLVPHPDYLILADDCADYHHRLGLDSAFSSGDGGQKEVHVVNPGNFSLERSFVVIYPASEDVQPSKVPNS